MTTPNAYKPAKPNTLRLVTKTSVSYPKKALALFIILWYSYDQPSSIEYGINEWKTSEVTIDEPTLKHVKNFLVDYVLEVDDETVDEALRNNPLFTSQLEALNACFELVWHLGSLKFSDLSNQGAERKGGIRLKKQIIFSCCMDVIDAAFDEGNSISALASVLINWLAPDLSEGSPETEKRLVKILTAFAENSFYRTCSGSKGEVFVPNGIYSALLEGNDTVEIVEPEEEIMGPTRILRSAISTGLNSVLQPAKKSSSRSSTAVTNKVDLIYLKKYAERAEETMNLLNVEFDSNNSSNQTNLVSQNAQNDNLSHNLVYFGAPGTGKSYKLAQDAEIFNGNVHRVTFYPDYTYNQFVGGFKPYSILEDSNDESSNSGDTKIEYRFVPGPFMETYLEALKKPKEKHLLVVEEINRANAAAVFGDLFQLLDRGDDNTSEYPIATPIEMRDWLKDEGLPETEARALKLPANFYIWATMNSADQGVFPMDTAFKRRWDFRYVGINNDEHVIADFHVKIPMANETERREISWNNLRKGINDVLCKAGINEDKFLGPFFINPRDLKNSDRFDSVFKDKVLFYLYEDAAKIKKDAVFTSTLGKNPTYSDICSKYDSDGVGVFNDFHFPKNFIASDVVDEAASGQESVS